MDGQSALILDIGVGSAFIEHYGAARTGQKCKVSFRWQAADITFDAEIKRTTIIKPPGEESSAPVSHSGVRFTSAVGDSMERLQDMMATFVTRILEAQKANAKVSSNLDTNILSQLGQARRSRTRGFVAYHWDGKRWRHGATESPKQLVDGFTVAGFEDEDEVESLCRTYEAADEEARHLIRVVAELSLVSAKT